MGAGSTVGDDAPGPAGRLTACAPIGYALGVTLLRSSVSE